MDRVPRRGRRAGGRDPGAVPPVQAPEAGAPAPGRAPAAHQHPLHQHDQPRAGALLPGRRGRSSGGSAGSSAGTPWPWSCAPTAGSRGSAATSPRTPRRRPCTRSGFNHFFRGKDGDGQRATRSSTRATPRRASTPGPSWRAASARTSSTTSGARRRPRHGLSSYPHPRLMPDFWEFPTVSMGLGPISRDLPGALQPLPREPRPPGHLEVARLGLPRRRRDGRARGARRAPCRRARGPRQPDLRRQLQPPATRRPGPRQRQDHPGARGRLPRLRLERDQGRLGPRVGRAPRPRRGRRPGREDEHDRRRRVPEVLGRRRRLHPRALLRAGPAPAPARRAPDRRRSGEAAPGRPRLPQGATRPTRRRPSSAAPRR